MKKSVVVVVSLVSLAVAMLAFTPSVALAGGDAHGGSLGESLPMWSCSPFSAMLLSIALFPLVAPHFWHHHFGKISVAWAVIFAVPFVAVYQGQAIDAILHIYVADYIPFIILLGALYTISGGIVVRGTLKGSPKVNTAILLIGVIIASWIGTTGAAMVLIRPLIRANAWRVHKTHLVVFFIFLVANIGGTLLPTGDPPLFLGYLQGVPFLWTFSLWKEWLTVNLSLLAIYWVWDSFFAYPRERLADREIDRVTARSLQVSGLTLNLPLMAGVILAVALLDPSKPLPGTDWHPWIFLREAVLLSLVGCSLWFGSTDIRVKNGFSYFAILEVAALFVGIFVCMQPALALLNEHGASLGIRSPGQFFWTTGLLSSVLDNAPTYLVFFKTAQSLPVEGDLVAGVEAGRLAGISLGAVFLGAMTYIGNGPNFMVKAIAEGAGVRMPSFFGYLFYSGGVLLPVFALTAWLFL